MTSLVNGIIIVLGAPNDALGNLSNIAVERCLEAAAVYRRHTGFIILPTGGFGNFNQTNKPHAHYTHNFLLGLGVPTEDILEPALSRFTREDATLSQPIVTGYNVTNLIVITSDFHLKRVELIFKKTFVGYTLSFRGSKTNLSRTELGVLLQHEEKAIAWLERR